MKKKVCIVGSGPSGASAAYQALKKGHTVVMYDPGKKIEVELENFQNRTQPVDRASYLKAIKDFRKKTAKSNNNIPAKLPFGSNFAYELSPELNFSKSKGTTLVASMAIGGLSNSWGSNICGVLDKDITDWPINSSDLSPYFDELRDIVDISGEVDQIDKLYGIDLGKDQNFSLSAQANNMMEDVSPHLSDLESEGVYFGRAKLAVGRKYSAHGKECVPCGLCMHGCPYNLIFNSASLVRELQKNPDFTYVSGRALLEFREDDEDKVFAKIQTLESGTVEEFSFDKIYIGAGVVSTTAIVARSLDWVDHEFTIKDSTKYLFPFIRAKATLNVGNDKTNTLAQIYIQFQKLKSTNKTVHMQLYGYNDLVLDPFRKILGSAAEIIPHMISPIINRFMIGMIYLHSDDSGHLKYKVNRDSQNGLGHISGVNIEKSDEICSEIFEIFKKGKSKFGGKPLGFLNNKNEAGNSQHFGGTLPMKDVPQRYESTKLGQPYGCRNVHIVDSSVVTSVTATPTTYTVMANALRIVDKSL